MLDLITQLDGVEAVPATAALTATTNGSAVDLRGCNAVAFFVTVGATGDTLSASNRFDLSVEVAEDDGAGNPTGWVALGANRQFGDAAVTAKSKTYKVGANADLNRYARLKLTAVGTHTSGNQIAAVAVRGHLQAEGKGW